MQGMAIEVKLAEYKEVVVFVHHLQHEIALICSQLKAKPAKEEAGQGTITLHEKKK